MPATLTEPPPASTANPLPPPAAPFPRKTLADLLRELGDIPADRVRLYPAPGTATEADAYWVNERERAVELVNGTLVEKAVGMRADYIGTILTVMLTNFVLSRRLGMVITGRAQFRMLRGNLREPEVSFTRKERMPNPLPEIGGWCPDLCVEVFSPSNTKAELTMKQAEYFANGCQLVWEIDPEARTATVYTGPDEGRALDESGTLDGGNVLPGFALSLKDLFAELDAISNPASA